MNEFVLDRACDLKTRRIVNYEPAALSPEHLVEIVTIRRIIENAFRTLIKRGIADIDFATRDDPRMSGTPHARIPD